MHLNLSLCLQTGSWSWMRETKRAFLLRFIISNLLPFVELSNILTFSFSASLSFKSPSLISINKPHSCYTWPISWFHFYSFDNRPSKRSSFSNSLKHLPVWYAILPRYTFNPSPQSSKPTYWRLVSFNISQPLSLSLNHVH